MADQWKPIETAPHNVDVLLFCPDNGIANPARIELGMASRGARVGAYSSVSHHGWATHWMPLPAPPVDQQKECTEHDWFVSVGEFVRTCLTCEKKSYSIERRGYRIGWSDPV